MSPVSRLLQFLVIVCVFAPKPGLCSEPACQRQIIVVITESWSDVGAKLYRFEKRAGKWEKAGGVVKAVVGENGMGWGVGVSGAGPAFPLKQEGDKKAPAGLFPLVKAMGYEASSSAAGVFPYEQIVENTRCVDDPDSVFYNRIVKESDFPVPVAGLWKSSEQMKRADDLYKKLVVVGYNMIGPQPGAGSCIFMHIWRSPTTGTTGCTAMAEKDLGEIVHWLKTGEHPSLVQLPLPVYKKYWREWQLPPPELLADP